MMRLRSCRTLLPARQAGRLSSWRSPFRCARLEPLEQRYLLSPAPVLDSLEDVEVLAGAPLHIALGAYDADGAPLTFSVTVEGNDDVTTYMRQQNRSLRISVEDFGDMVFELFEGRAPNTTARIIALAEAGFYNTTDPDDPMIFHRGIEDFMIQGGDPDGDGTGGCGVTFDHDVH